MQSPLYFRGRYDSSGFLRPKVLYSLEFHTPGEHRFPAVRNSRRHNGTGVQRRSQRPTELSRGDTESSRQYARVWRRRQRPLLTQTKVEVNGRRLRGIEWVERNGWVNISSSTNTVDQQRWWCRRPRRVSPKMKYIFADRTTKYNYRGAATF